MTRKMKTMKSKVRHHILRLPAIVLLSCIIYACANIGNPNGGPYDETPPKYVSSKPAMDQLNFKGGKIVILFDEYVSIENPQENVIITPPQKQTPVIGALGKKVTVELRDTLLAETTYTIDFTSSIVDFNEKNALENFSFAFSTGDVLDTMQISGIVINAKDNEPVSKMLVGIHRDLSDTAFTKTPFLRTSKTDEKGRFIIKNVSPGSYHLFALEDKNRNYAYDKNNNEGLAFLDSILIPSCERKILPDTIWKDSITVDTVMMIERTIFYPNDLVLWFFNDSVAPRQRMLRPERTKEHIITLKFNAPMVEFPKPTPLNFEPVDSVWYVTQKGEDAESFAINYWILDSMIYKKDTLQIEVSYMKNNDSIPDLLELQTDTLSIPFRATQTAGKDSRTAKTPPVRRPPSVVSDTTQTEPEAVPVVHLQMNISPSGSINPHDIITVMVNEPVLDIRKEHFVMEIAVDTLWQAVDFEFEPDSMRAMTYHIKRQFNYDERYRITVDSATFTSVYGHPYNKTTVQMTVKGKKEYGHFTFFLKGLPVIDDSGTVMPAFMELLNSAGLPVRKAIVENGIAKFPDMNADKYFARIILDANGNGIWDAGNYEERRQPERVQYCHEKIEILQNFNQETEWNINDSNIGYKPVELLKNKPKEVTKTKRDHREESRPQSNRSSTPNIGGLRF